MKVITVRLTTDDTLMYRSTSFADYRNFTSSFG
jgi:hypothetical protein